MSSRQEIEQAIVVLEAERDTLGAEVVDVSLATLRRKLQQLQSQPVAEQYDEAVVLVADLSDYTALSESMDPEDLRDTINALWKRLDRTIDAWGGALDKHTGDGLIALFGIPTRRGDDMERAILAALDMQMELALFNQGTTHSPAEHNRFRADLRMRIGIHSGPVFFGKIGMSDELSALGEAVRKASRLQRAAPVDGVLITYDVYSKVHVTFDAERLSLTEMPGDTDLLGSYLVTGEKPHSYRDLLRSLSMTESRLIGRQAELERLQTAVQETMDSGRAHFMTVTGEAGVGKSRLLYEFQQLIKLLPMKITQFNGRAQRGVERHPYALIRDLFLTTFDVHAMSSPAITREKLKRGFERVLRQGERRAVEHVRHVGKLLGFEFAIRGQAPVVRLGTDLIPERTHDKVAEFFRTIALGSPITFLVLEDVHLADERSLDLVDYIFEACCDVPLLVVCSARPELFENRPAWKLPKEENPHGRQELHLMPLSAIDSRHLVAEVIKDKTPLSVYLTDLIVERTGGNPGYIQNLTRMLIESDVIVKEASQWRVQVGELEEKQMLPTFTNLLQRRLAQLPQLERETLQEASVFGRTFWKSAIVQVSKRANNPDITQQVEDALWSLEQQDLIDRRSVSDLPSTQEFVFKHNRLRNLAYESIPAQELRQYHARAAEWLIVHNNPRLSQAASIIAGHFERAEEIEKAAAWHRRAGTYAQEAHAPETAIQHYRYALRLVSDGAEAADQRIPLYEGLGEMLCRRAQFNKATSVYQHMLKAARTAEDSHAEIRALLGIALTQRYQDDYAAALASSRQAELIARKSGSVSQLTATLVATGWALAHLNEIDKALELSKEALTISTAAGEATAIADSNGLIGYICRLQHWFDQGNRATKKARKLIRKQGDHVGEASLVRNLGHVALMRGDFNKARTFFREALFITRDIGDRHGTIRSLQMLGRVAERQGDHEQAIRRTTQAFNHADMGANTNYCAQLAGDIGMLHLDRGTPAFQNVDEHARDVHMRQARVWLEKALRLAAEADVPMTLATTQASMAQLLIGEELPNEALPLAIKALETAEHEAKTHPTRNDQENLGIFWRVVGQVASELLPQDLPIVYQGRSLDAADCFNISIRHLAQIGRGYEGEMARTLYMWALFELGEGRSKRGTSLLQRSRDLFTQLGMVKEAEWLGQSTL